MHRHSRDRLPYSGVVAADNNFTHPDDLAAGLILGSLSPEALAVLTINIQKRDVIGHNLGVADAAFAEHAVDARLSETVPLVRSHCRRYRMSLKSDRSRNRAVGEGVTDECRSRKPADSTVRLAM